MDTQPFDPLASTYDDTFTHTPIGRYLRARVHSRLEQHFHAGDHVLELGCGTGEDALYLAQRGVQVTATDASDAMLVVARAKTQANPLVRVEKLDLRDLVPHRQSATDISPIAMGEEGRGYDGIFANFGPVNVLDDWQPLAAWLAEQIKPGGIVGLGVMGPVCLWEMGWHGLHLDFKTAFRRLSKSATFQADDTNEPIQVSYPSINRLTHDFAPQFRRVHVEALGLFLPPSDVYGVIEKRPRLLKLLTQMEERFAKYPVLAHFGDHYWIEFERTS